MAKVKIKINELKFLLNNLEDYVEETLKLTDEFINENYETNNKDHKKPTYDFDIINEKIEIIMGRGSNNNITKLVYTYAPTELKKRLELCNKVFKELRFLKIKPKGLDMESNLELIPSYSSTSEKYFTIKDEGHILDSPLKDIDIYLKENYATTPVNIIKVLSILKKMSKENILVLFDQNNKLLKKYRGKDLSDIDLSNVDFKDKDISYMNLSSNINNLSLDLSNIEKSLHRSNIKGYDGKGYILRNFDIRDAILEDTNLGIDILSCMISYPEKMSSGTIFDTNNEFYLGKKKIEVEQAKQLGLNIKGGKNGK